MQELYGAAKDYLTNCYTRDSLNPFLNRMEAEYHLNRTPFSIFILDVDHFKFFNDKYGHLCGDEVLKYFASSLRLDLEEEVNAPFRFGGDEFVVVFPGKSAREVFRLAWRLRRNIKTRPCLYKGKNIKMGFSGGIACFPEDAKSVEELLDKADRALYFSKKSGRGRVVMYRTLKIKSIVLQVTLGVLLCVAVGVIYVFQDYWYGVLSKLGHRLKTVSLHYQWKLPRMPGKPGPLRTQTPSAVETVPAPAPPADTAPAVPTEDVIHLKSGRLIRGVIIKETDEEVRVEIKFTGGKGSLGLKKADIEKIERAVPV